MDEFTHIINGMDIEGVLNGGDFPVVVDGRFTGKFMLKRCRWANTAFLLESCLPHMWKSAGSLTENWFATH